MITAKFKLNGVKVERFIPTKWAEITFGRYIDLSEGSKDESDVFSILTSIDKNTLQKAKINNLDTILSSISFLKTSPPGDIPETILGYKIPFDLGFETIAQYEDLKNDMSVKRDANEQIKRYPLYCAMYACSQKHGEYDWKKAEEMAEEFLHAPAGEVLAIGNFTLARLIALKNGIDPGSLIRTIRPKRSKLGLKLSRILSGFMVRYYIWRKKRAIAGKSF